MKKSFKKSLSWAFGIVTAVFTVVPESVFGIITWIPESLIASVKIFQAVPSEVNTFITRLVFFFLVWTLVFVLFSLFFWMRPFIDIKGSNYAIRIEYGDLLKKKNCKRVISFDECFSTNVGNGPGDIKPTSICGQYLIQHPSIDLHRIIDDAKLKPLKKKSEFEKRPRYQPGSIAPNGDDLLMAFAPLDENGRGVFSHGMIILLVSVSFGKKLISIMGKKMFASLC